jgi:uncharacterized membrane protein
VALLARAEGGRVKPRFALVDSVRGFALLIMFAFHFCFDLNLYGAAQIDFSAPFWIWYRNLILVLFLGVVGVSISLAGRRWPDPLRVLRLAFCAGAVSLGTRILFPGEWVFFGVLHFVLVASIVVPPLARFPRACLVLGILFMVPVPWYLKSPRFDGGVLQLTGLATRLPNTIDFVPLFPWLGVVLSGVFLGSLLPRCAPWLSAENPLLARLGRHSLLFYVTHQGVLLPLAWLVRRIHP